MVTCGTLTVEENFDPGAIQFTNCDMAASSITVDDLFNPTLRVENNNDVTVGVEATLLLDGSMVRESALFINPNGYTEWTPHVTPSTEGISAGTYQVSFEKGDAQEGGIGGLDAPAAPSSEIDEPTSLLTDGGLASVDSLTRRCGSCGH